MVPFLKEFLFVQFAMIIRYGGGGVVHDLVLLVKLWVDLVSRGESTMNFVFRELMDTRVESVEVSMTHIQM